MNETLRKLMAAAHRNEELKKRLLETRQAADPMDAFCELATKEGFPISIGELIDLGEEFTSNLLKSTNGGATYPIEDWNDAYESFFAGL